MIDWEQLFTDNYLRALPISVFDWTLTIHSVFKCEIRVNSHAQTNSWTGAKVWYREAAEATKLLSQNVLN